MAFSLIASVALVPTSGTGGTTSARDTTGADLIVIGVSVYQGFFGLTTISDNKGNTWTALTNKNAAAVADARLYYCLNPTVGSNHTFTLGGGSTFGTICVQAWSGSLGASAYDQESGATTSTGVSSVSLPSITAAVANSLFVTVFSHGETSGSSSIDLSFAITDQLNNDGVNFEGIALAWVIGTTKAPTWTRSLTPTYDLAAAMAVFKPAGGAAFLAAQQRGIFQAVKRASYY